MTSLITNVHVYLAIAEEAAAESARLLEVGRRQKPGGDAGYVLTFDPDQRSFKQSLIAIVFAATYLEALIAIVGSQRLGGPGYLAIDRMTWEEKLKKLGIEDSDLLGRCQRFRQSRKDVLHEKAGLTDSLYRTAQDEAAFGIDLVREIARRLQSLLKPRQGSPDGC